MRTSFKQLLGRLAIATVAVAALPVQAATETITFDEPGISLGDFITNQFTGIGVSFGGTPAGTVKNGTTDFFGNPFPTDGNIIHFDEQTVDVSIDFAVDVSFLSFEFRRPSQSRNVTIDLLNDGQSVFSQTVTAIDDWAIFDFNGLVDQVTLRSDRKFVFDNLSFTPVPVPPAAMLAALPLVAVLRRRRPAR